MFNFIDRFIRKNSLHLILFNILFTSAIDDDPAIKRFLLWTNIILSVLLLFFYIRHDFRSFCYRIKEPPAYTLNDKLLDAYVFLMSLVLSLIQSGNPIGWMKEHLSVVLFLLGYFLFYLWDIWTDGKLTKWKKKKQ